ncbi:MAG: hydroxymethylpyrimidine/phosphomethylpyrimidine kinase [Acidobacteriaceae bacterium]
MKTVLTIAGFDPSSGAGVSADLMVFAAHSLFGTACITALTVQSTLGVQSSHPVAAEIVAATLQCLEADLSPAGIKIGLISNKSISIVISHFLEILYAQISDNLNPQLQVVLDPVVRSSSGMELLDTEGIAMLRRRLLPLVDWITPNLAELAVLSGEEVVDREDVPRACLALQAALAPARIGRPLGILATGGHLDPPDDFLLMPDGTSVWLPGERIVTRSTHGTGCALSSAFLSRLVLGDSAIDAARAAKRYVVEAMQAAEHRGGGASGMNYLWRLPKPKT